VVRPDLRIRPARPGERTQLLELWERSVRATHLFLAEHDVLFYRPLVAEFLAKTTEDLFVLVDGADRPIGFMALAGNALDALFLDPAHRGQGAGRALVAFAQEQRPGPLTVEVNEQNEPAVAFYQALGFSIEGRLPVDDTGRPFPILQMVRSAPPVSRS